MLKFNEIEFYNYGESDYKGRIRSALILFSNGVAVDIAQDNLQRELEENPAQNPEGTFAVQAFMTDRRLHRYKKDHLPGLNESLHDITRELFAALKTPIERKNAVLFVTVSELEGILETASEFSNRTDGLPLTEIASMLKREGHGEAQIVEVPKGRQEAQTGFAYIVPNFLRFRRS